MTGSNTAPASAISFSTGLTLNVTGIVYGGTFSSTAYGVAQNSATSSTTYAQLVPQTAPAVQLVGGTCVVNSAIPAAAVTTIALGTSSASVALTVNGNVTGGTAAATSAIDFTSNSASAGTITITGNVTGGSGLLSPAITGPASAGVGTITINGNAIASATSNAIRTVSTAVGNAVVLNGNTTDATNGVNAIWAQRWYFGGSPASRSITVSNNALSAYTFYGDTTWAATQPAQANVRFGTVFGSGNIYTGSLRVPPAGSVALGVLVDAGTGTLTMTASDLRAAVGLASANLDTQFTAIPGAVRTNLATELGRIDVPISDVITDVASEIADVPAAVRTNLALELSRIDANVSSGGEPYYIAIAVREELAPELNRIDVNVSQAGNEDSIAVAVRDELSLELGRLDIHVSDIVTEVAAVPAAVRTELDPELDRIDVAVSSRLATAGYTAPSVPPTAAAIADEVRVELAPELARIDVPVSSAGDPGEIADAVRTELTPELDRVANCSTVDTTGAQLAALL